MAPMLVVLLALWLIGVLTGYTMGGLIHVLIVVAIVVLIVRRNQRRAAFYK